MLVLVLDAHHHYAITPSHRAWTLLLAWLPKIGPRTEWKILSPTKKSFLYHPRFHKILHLLIYQYSPVYCYILSSYLLLLSSRKEFWIGQHCIQQCFVRKGRLPSFYLFICLFNLKRNLHIIMYFKLPNSSPTRLSIFENFVDPPRSY